MPHCERCWRKLPRPDLRSIPAFSWRYWGKPKSGWSLSEQRCERGHHSSPPRIQSWIGNHSVATSGLLTEISVSYWSWVIIKSNLCAILDVLLSVLLKYCISSDRCMKETRHTPCTRDFENVFFQAWRERTLFSVVNNRKSTYWLWLRFSVFLSLSHDCLYK